MNALAYRIAISSIFIVLGCSRHDDGTLGPLPQATGTALEQLPSHLPPSGDWETVTVQSSAIKAEVGTLRQGVRNVLRDNLSHLRLSEVETGGGVGAAPSFRFFQVQLSKLHDGLVFVVPKLFVQSSILGGRVESSSDAFGRITLRFPIALLDGLSPSMSTGVSALPVPESYRIESPSELRGKLSSTVGHAIQLVAFPGCPKEMRLEFGKESLPVTPLISDEGCPTNQLFEATVTGTQEQIRMLIEEDLAHGQVRIAGRFELSPHFVTEIRSIAVRTSQLRERLYKKFIELPYGVGAGDFLLYPSRATRQGLTDVLKTLFDEAGLKLDAVVAIYPLIDELLANHFSSESCAEDGGICFRLRTEPIVDEPVIDFETHQVERVQTENEPLEISTRVQGLSGVESSFTIAGEQTDDSAPSERGRKGGLLRPIQEGDLIELELSRIDSSKRQYAAPILDPSVSRLDNPVCVKWGEPPVRDEPDYSVCLEWNTVCARSHETCVSEEAFCAADHEECVERGKGLCFFCCKHVGRVCDRWATRCTQSRTDCDEWKPTSCKRFGTKKVPAGPAPCMEVENQWSKFWRLSELPSIVRTAESPTTFDSETLFSGLQIQFSGWEPGPTGRFGQMKTTCPLSAFFPSSEQKEDRLQIRFRVQNNRDAGCAPFNRWNRQQGREPELTLINQLTRAEKYACGFREEFWNGRMKFTCPRLGLVSDQPLFDIYYPRYAVSGVLRLPGVTFSSTQSGAQFLNEKQNGD